MKVAFHLAIPKPPHPELDAAVQDAMKITDHVDGEINYLYPGKEVKKWVPRFLSGLHQLPYLIRLDNHVDVHHIFSNGLYPYPILMLLKKPVVCTSVIGVGNVSARTTMFLKRQLSAVVVSTTVDKIKLDKCGLKSKLVYPGINIDKFSFENVVLKEDFILMIGSAPWTEKQFVRKGVDMILQAASDLPWLHLVFLWRGKLLKKMHQKIKQYGVAEKVKIISRHVDVNTVLKDVHGGVLLADDPDIIKSYPHSLLESMAAGKPVVVSSVVPVVDFVKKEKCGVAVDVFDVACLKNAIQKLRNNYDMYVKNVSEVDMGLFSSEQMVASYLKIYKNVCSDSS